MCGPGNKIWTQSVPFMSWLEWTTAYMLLVETIWRVSTGGFQEMKIDTFCFETVKEMLQAVLTFIILHESFLHFIIQGATWKKLSKQLNYGYWLCFIYFFISSTKSNADIWMGIMNSRACVFLNSLSVLICNDKCKCTWSEICKLWLTFLCQISDWFNENVLK